MIFNARNKLAFGLLASSFSSNFVDGQTTTCPRDKTGVEGFIVNDSYYGTKTKCLYVIDGTQQWEALGLTWAEAQVGFQFFSIVKGRMMCMSTDSCEIRRHKNYRKI